MPDNKKYPKGFSPYTEPHPPIEPKKPEKRYLQENRIVWSESGDGSKIKKTVLDTLDYDYIEIISSDYYDPYDTEVRGTPDLRVIKEIFKEKTDKQFTKELLAYEKAFQKFEKEKLKFEDTLKEWKRLKKRWDDETLSERDEFERKEFERLSKKFGNTKK